MRRSEEQVVLGAPHWICVETECEDFDSPESLLNKTAEDVRRAMLAFQIWRPKGWSAIIVNSESSVSGGLRVRSVTRPRCYSQSAWARQLSIDSQPVNELTQIVDGTFAALESDAVSAKNPFQYLEIGLQTVANNLKAGALLWMIGLDALSAAQKRDVFKARLCRLLGEDGNVFPQNLTGRQPAYKVGDLAADVYELRNQIAHGDRIRDKFLIKSDFRLEPDLRGFHQVPERSYQSVLCEAALFMLCAALRRVILDGDIMLLAKPKEWKAWLDKAKTV